MRPSETQCEAFALAIIGSVAQYVEDNQEAYILFLEENYGKDSATARQEMSEMATNHKRDECPI